MLDTILNRADVKEFLNETLTDSRFMNKPFQNSPYSENYAKNQYSLLLVMDAFIKYAIIIEDLNFIDEYIMQIRRIMKKVDSYNDIVYGINTILAKIIAVKEKIKDLSLEESKRKVLEYVYRKYIKEGYCFHSFPSILADNIKENGLDPKDYNFHLQDLKEVKSIFAKYNIKDIMMKDFNCPNSYITLTDSPMIAYFYAFNAPMYLSELCAMNDKMENQKKYDKGAYYRKDYNKCKNNLTTLCKKIAMADEDSKRVLEIFDQEWREFDNNKAEPTIAFISRKIVDKNKLKDFDQILENCSNIDIAYSIAKITESKFNDYKIFDRIDQKDIYIQEMPSYKEILKVIEPYEEIQYAKKKDIVPFSPKLTNASGNVSVLALIGVLFLTLGATLTILFSIYGG